ncbi:MAG: hypothetical protein ACI4B3_01130 [Prevotella sp.]
MAAGANAQTETPLALGGGWNAGFAGDADVYNYTITSQWGAADFTCNVLAADYPKFVLEFDEPLPANFQVNYSWKASAEAEGDATPAYGRAVGDGSTKKFELYFDKDNHPYITSVSVQHTDAVEANLAIKKLQLVPESGENIIVSPSFTSWAGTDNTVMYKGTVSYNSQWQQLQLKDVAGKSDITVKVELVEDAQEVQMCVDYEDGSSEWPQFVGKVATLTTKEGAAVKTIGIQYVGTSEAKVAVAGAWLISNSTGISKIDVAAENAEYVNVAGQPVGKNYKGLVINKATGAKKVQ